MRQTPPCLAFDQFRATHSQWHAWPPVATGGSAGRTVSTASVLDLLQAQPVSSKNIIQWAAQIPHQRAETRKETMTLSAGRSEPYQRH